ncbi:MAG: hypothetical protein CMQ41_05695 [Gammaproteobacteria bacterium]|nr:hypothetical protein [Gammaproteobacteria bacterium]
MIFSLLNLRKKTAAILAGIAIAAFCLWGISIWHNISAKEMLSVLLATLIMLSTIILTAFIIIVLFNALKLTVNKTKNSESETTD